jgi:hypothetical protein
MNFAKPNGGDDDIEIDDNFVLYRLFTGPSNNVTDLDALHAMIMEHVKPYTSGYLWHQEPFHLRASTTADITELRGKTYFGDCIDDEWFIVFLLYEISKAFPALAIRFANYRKIDFHIIIFS